MEEEKKGNWMDKITGGALAQIQGGWDRCSICRKPLPPGSPMNKLYDDKLGEITACVGCSLKSILWYVRKLYNKSDGE